MRFVFNERKAAHAASLLLMRHGGRLKYLTLIKLLYLADRRSLVETGYPITGDRFVSMDKGPVLSIVKDLITWEPDEETTPWHEYIVRQGLYDVSLKIQNPNLDELSKYEIQILEEIDEEFGGMNRWDLVALTHELPEWEDPKGSSVEIDPADILRAENKSPDEIRRIGNNAEDIWFVHSLARKAK
ncbi:MAG: Panacea domain-containing protein [Nitrospinota bacterium]